jgi:hypothetical protein
VGVLELPDRPSPEDETLRVGDTMLSELALASALATAAGETVEHPDVAQAFVGLADDIGVGTRFDAVTFEQEDRPARRSVRLDRRARDRLRDAIRDEARSRADSLTGVLTEADFEKHTARLRSPAGDAVVVRFDETLDDDIQEALRRQSQFVGEVRYDPKTSQARDVQLRRVLRTEQLMFGIDPGDFWASQTVDELATERGIAPVDDARVLRDTEASPDEVERLLAALQDM